MNGWQRHIGLFATLFTVLVMHDAWGAAIGITNTQALAFGKFAAGTGGSVIVSTSGARSATGSVILLTSVAGAAAQFNITGDPSLTYAITLPANDTIALADGSSHTMAVNSFVSSPDTIGTLSSGGAQTLSVGATLIVNNAQVAGTYSGTFDVIVNYN